METVHTRSRAKAERPNAKAGRSDGESEKYDEKIRILQGN